jgi:hypothetical protein
METLGDTLVNHFDSIAAYRDHPMRFSTDGDYAMLTKHPQRAGAY